MANLQVSDLEPGDVLLCFGSSPLACMITWLDQGNYSHAAFFDGEQVVQADGRGVNREPIDTSPLLKLQRYIDVFRFNKGGHPLGTPGWEAQPVVDRAEQIVAEGHKYAYDHLLLLGLLALSRDVAELLLSPTEQAILRVVMDHAASWIFETLDKGTEPMVCSEAVYRFYAEAAPPMHYAPTILGTLFKRLQALERGGPQSELWAAKGEYADTRRKLMSAWQRLKAARSAAGGSPEWDPVVAACVTPHDLETSPDLYWVGRFKGPPTLGPGR